MWKQQVVVINFIVINCFIQISCNITSNHTSSVKLIDNIVNNNDKSEKHIEEVIAANRESLISQDSLYLSNTEGLTTKEDNFECYCHSADQDCFKKCLDDDDDGDDDDEDESSLTNMFLLTVGEVLLGCAIIMGLSALVTMALRVCTRSTMSRNRHDVSDFMDTFERNNNRASLTSLQQTVITKLRDRPPRYETRHNYEYRRRDDGGRVAVLNPAAAAVTQTNGAPPPYESADNDSVHELPPAYTITLPSDDHGGTINSANGIANQSFTTISDENRQQRDNESGTSENHRQRNNGCDDIGHNQTGDSIIYI